MKHPNESGSGTLKIIIQETGSGEENKEGIGEEPKEKMKICPLLSASSETYHYCSKGKCAFWVEMQIGCNASGMCAAVAAAVSLWIWPQGRRALGNGASIQQR